MGSACAGPNLLRSWISWISWLKGGFILRLLGLPVALFALHLELYGDSPAQTSLILHRLRRRLRLTTLFCLSKDHDTSNLSFLGGADVINRDSQMKPSTVARKPSTTLETSDQAFPSGGSSTFIPSSKHNTASSSNSPMDSFPQPSTNPSLPSHSRSMSHADVVTQGKRLSLNFPIQPAAGSASPRLSPRSRPQSWVATPLTSPDVAPSPTEGNFLAVLATQERRVLELKEELAKAEEDLKSLKKHWATHEAMKKRNEVRKVTQLEPLNTTLANFGGDTEDEDGSSLWMQKEMERRKAMLTNTRTSQRKVFSGSRHMRTLSLLSPDKANYSPSFPQPPDARNSDESPNTPNTLKPQPLSRSSTTPDIATVIANNVTEDKYDLGNMSALQRDAILKTGKQMASDLKDGLLTFIEDIRQATVGEEGVNGAGADAANRPRATRTVSGKSTRKPSDGRPILDRAASSNKQTSSETPDLIDIGDSFWKENGLSEPKPTPAPKVTKPKGGKTLQKSLAKTPQKAKDEFEDSWDTWDTPNDKYLATHNASSSISSTEDTDGQATPASGRSSTRTSTSSIGTPGHDTSSRNPNRNSIPWPDLVKLSPTNLKRTASHLMKEWEKNLTPPPEARDLSHGSGDYIGRSASPARKTD